jgi:hypothetical protein
MEQGQIVILNGPPRSGKSSVAAEIQDRFAGLWNESAWLDGLRRDGPLTRVMWASLPFAEAIQVLDALHAPDERMPVFADRVLHDTKALTDGPVRPWCCLR